MLDQEADISDISADLCTDEPFVSQKILSYVLRSEDDWKLGNWRNVLMKISCATKNFVLSFQKIEQIVNEVLRLYESPCILTAETLSLVLRSLVNTRWLLLSTSVLQHICDHGLDVDLINKFHSSLSESKLPEPVEVNNEAFFFARLSYRFQRLLMRLSSAGCIDDNNIQENASRHGDYPNYRVSLERHLPYNEKLSCKPLSDNSTVIVLPVLQYLMLDFFSLIRLLNEESSASNRPGFTNTGPNTSIVDSAFIMQFLSDKIGHSISKDHILIFLWFLTYYGSIRALPFLCEFDGTNSPNSAPLQALKICFDSHKTMEITIEDKAAILENFAENILLKKLNFWEVKIASLDQYCLSNLQGRNREGALFAYKRKKLLEEQVKNTQKQLLKIEELHHMRDREFSLGLLTNILQATLDVTKLNTSLMQNSQALMEGIDDVDKTQAELERKLCPEHYFDESLQNEYDQLMSNLTMKEFEKLQAPPKKLQKSSPTETVSDKIIQNTLEFAAS